MASISNSPVTTADLRDRAWDALGAHFLLPRDLSLLQEGVATKKSLATAKAALAETEKLAAMTAPGAADSSHQFDRVTITVWGPDPWKVTVAGDTVDAVVNERRERKYLGGLFTHTETNDMRSKGERANVHEWASKAATAGQRLVGAIESRLAAQSGIETALAGVRERVEPVLDRIRR
ncbi:MAG: hypothetical protein ACAI38_08850 [Myxococcota bacterium]